MLRVLELFAGIGACSKALERLGIEHEVVDAVEIDKYAVQSFNAVHGTNFEPQDITKWDKGIQVDLIMHGSPCQDFSVAGKQAGGDAGSGTRSSLMYETLRIVEKLKPKYVIWENVKNLLSKKHKHNFDAYIEAMSKLGYVSKYQVLNAKDYGVPQNRERVFTVSILDGGSFDFPEKQELTKKLKDVLDEDVDEKFYLSDEQTQRMKHSTFKSGNFENRVQTGDTSRTLCARDFKDPKCIRVGGLYDSDKTKHQAGSVYDPRGISATLSTMQGGNQEPIIMEDFYSSREPREYSESAPTLRSQRIGLKVAEPTIVASRGRGENNEQHLEPRKDNLTNTITSVQKDNYVAEPMRIRKLTPKECWRLMGFDDSDFEKAQASGVSNSQLYKQAGNSIVVNVLEGILRNLLS